MLQVDRTHKNIIRIINDVEFSIDIESNSEDEDFSAVKFKLNNEQ